MGLKVYSFDDFIETYSKNDINIFVAMTYSNMNTDREYIFNRFKSYGFSFETYISKNSFIDKKTKIGSNVFIFEGNVVQYNCTIEDNVIIWSGNHIGHSSHVKSNCFISSHVVISGGVTVGKNSFLGVNSTIVNEIEIKPYSLVGAGAVIHKSTFEEGQILIGNPAKAMEQSVFEKYNIRKSD
jgi:sugar O-acyltransferase (sialic acid O-acetyltransferase NeuD family)